MTTIGVDGNEANVDKKVGVSVYTQNLLFHFSKAANSGLRFEIYLKTPPLAILPAENDFFHYRTIKADFLWSQIALPLYLISHRNIDVYFAPAHYLPSFCPVPQVVTIHDLAYLYFPDDFTKKDLWQLKTWTDRSIKVARRIIAVSKTTKKDILKNYQIDESRISVIYNGFEKQIDKLKNNKLDLIKKLKIKNEKYILFVGTIQPRKNLKVLIDSFDQFVKSNKNFKLVIAGKKGWLYESIFEKVKSMNLEEKVFFADHVSDEELIWLYQNAFCLVQPSLYEGFGIPVLEAMSYGCPVVSSFSSSLPEVGGDAGLYFDPKNSEDLYDKLMELKENEPLRKEFVIKGKKRVKEFSWEKCGEETLDVIISTVGVKRN